MNIARTLLLLVANCALALGGAHAQTFPSRPITVVVGFPAGSSTDFIIRLAADDMAKTLGQPVVINNMTGANGTIAGNYVAKAKPDGYTLYHGPASAISPLFNKNNGVDVGRSFVPVSNLAAAPYVFFTSAKLPVTTLPELVAWSKANPGKLNLGSGAVNTAILGAVLKAKTGLIYENIFYKGSGPIVPALLNGEVGFTATISTSAVMPHVRAGTVRTLFVTSPARFPPMPDVPTAAELGLQNFDAGTLLGLWAPQGTPREIVDKLSAAAAAAVRTPEVRAKLRAETVGIEPDGSTPDELLRLYNEEVRFWTEAARLSNYQPE
jgi:tripartite-type tricarboxylate transporter receptor subunit TctC